MNKNDLIQQLSDRTGIAKNDAAKAVDGVFDLIQDALKAGDEVRLTGFGVFVVATRAGGKGRNPQTGEEITIKPSKQPRFRPGKQLKDALNCRRESEPIPVPQAENLRAGMGPFRFGNDVDRPASSDASGGG